MKKLFTILMAAVIALTLAGCSKQEAPQECVDLANQFINAYSYKNFESMYEMTNDKYPYLSGMYNKDEKVNSMLFDALTDNLEVKITGGNDFGDTANVTLHIKTADAITILGNIVSDFTNLYKQNPDSYKNMDMDAELEKIVKSYTENPPMTERDSQIDFIKQDGKWVIESNVGIYDDLTGGFLTYYFDVNVLQNVGGQGMVEKNE